MRSLQMTTCQEGKRHARCPYLCAAAVHHNTHRYAIAAARVVIGGRRLGMMIPRAKVPGHAAMSDFRLSSSRKCRCMSSGRGNEIFCMFAYEFKSAERRRTRPRAASMHHSQRSCGKSTATSTQTAIPNIWRVTVTVACRRRVFRPHMTAGTLDLA